MAEPVRARRLTEDEGRRLQQTIRRGKHESIRVRRALIIQASSAGTPAPAIARLVAAHEDMVRDVIHDFNQRGLACLDPNWGEAVPAASLTMTLRSSPDGQGMWRWHRCGRPPVVAHGETAEEVEGGVDCHSRQPP